MSPLQLIVLAVVSMVCLAALRVLRDHVGRTPLPGGWGRRLFLLAFVVAPPIALGLLIDPAASASVGLTSLPVYVAILAVLVGLMSTAELLVRPVTHGRSGRLVRIALVGNEGDPEVLAEPPVTAKLAESILVVERANAVFPRGPEFPRQVARADFRSDWDALDAATRTLESRIADDHGRGLAVASAATVTARDARGRLDTLRRLAGLHGDAWVMA